MSFNINEIITDPEILFGRNKPKQLLSILIDNIRRNNNIQLQGEKRTGKTSTLKCLINQVQKERFKIIPIYINTKDHSFIKGNINIYRYILSHFFSKLTKDGAFVEAQIVYDIQIYPTKNWEDYYTQFTPISDYKISGLFNFSIPFFSSLLDKSILLIFDEYEYLFKYSFDDYEGFFPIRTLSEAPAVNGIKNLLFIIAGAKSWYNLEYETGSPALNTLGTEILYLTPLDFNDFLAMWKYHINKSNEKNLINIDSHEVFNLSGGVPFYAKVIGNYYLDHGKLPNFDILIPYFEEIIRNTGKQELSILYSAADYKLISNPVSRKLVKIGLLKNDSTGLVLNGELFSQYIRHILNSSLDEVDKRPTNLSKLSKSIGVLMANICLTSRNKTANDMFIPVIDDALLLLDIETICVDKDGIIRFASAMYKIAFEKTRIKRSLDTLPANYKLDHPTIVLIDQFRHHFGGHLTTGPAFKPKIEKGDLLQQILGSRNEPDGDDFYKTQHYILTLYEKYLIDLYSFVKKNTNW